jgi:hypothetical protein
MRGQQERISSSAPKQDAKQNLARAVVRSCSILKGRTMAKGQMRSSREARKAEAKPSKTGIAKKQSAYAADLSSRN